MKTYISKRRIEVNHESSTRTDFPIILLSPDLNVRRYCTLDKEVIFGVLKAIREDNDNELQNSMDVRKIKTYINNIKNICAPDLKNIIQQFISCENDSAIFNEGEVVADNAQTVEGGVVVDGKEEGNVDGKRKRREEDTVDIDVEQLRKRVKVAEDKLLNSIFFPHYMKRVGEGKFECCDIFKYKENDKELLHVVKPQVVPVEEETGKEYVFPFYSCVNDEQLGEELFEKIYFSNKVEKHGGCFKPCFLDKNKVVFNF